jgi:AcrR family transcriptional regulator
MEPVDELAARRRAGTTKKALSRARIIAAAMTLLEQEGELDFTSVEAQSGITFSTIRKHYVTKTALMGTVLMEALEQELQEWRDGNKTPERLVEAMMRLRKRFPKWPVPGELSYDVMQAIKATLLNEGIKLSLVHLELVSTYLSSMMFIDYSPEIEEEFVATYTAMISMSWIMGEAAVDLTKPLGN